MDSLLAGLALGAIAALCGAGASYYLGWSDQQSTREPFFLMLGCAGLLGIIGVAALLFTLWRGEGFMGALVMGVGVTTSFTGVSVLLLVVAERFLTIDN